VITGLAIAAAFRQVRGSDSGVFGDNGRHAPEQCCRQANVERVNDRSVIWRPPSKNKKDCLDPQRRTRGKYCLEIALWFVQ